MPARVTAKASTPAILQELHDIRAYTVRDAQRVVELGTAVIERGWTKSRSDEVWVFLEQVGGAAVECGKFDLAEICATRLSEQFPDSPRVAVLLGTVLEGRGQVDEAKALYEKRLQINESDLNIRKRLISLHLYSGDSSGKGKAAADGLSREKGVDLLVEYLDTFYSDPEGWSQLASVYASMQMYAQSLSALAHLILLVPQNPYYLQRHAETAYTLGDIHLAYKEFLRVVEMSDGLQGVGRRAAMGVRACIARLRTSTAPQPADSLLRPQELDKIDLLMANMLLDAYKVSGAQSTGIVRQWVGSSGRAETRR